MKIFLNKKDLIKYAHNEKNLGFVPTMGAFHKGHISLFKRSISESSKTVVTIFVNKPQFNRNSDYKNYPRNLKRDISILKKLKISYLYIPTNKQIYPNGINKRIKISPFSKRLCGKNRPGHFEAVADVLDRFIKIIKPKRIYLGEKDMQQLKIVELFFKKKHKNVRVVGCKTKREKNGLACSSRNFLLTNKEKYIASKIYKLLVKEKKNLLLRKISINHIKKKIKALGISRLDYIKLIDVNKIITSLNNIKKYKIFIAYYLKSTRLIDNI